MEDTVAVAAFGALAHPRRLKIFKLLDACGAKGMNAGAIAREIRVPPSSLSFHLHLLEDSGLLRSARYRQQIIYSVEADKVVQLRGFLEKCETCESH